MNERGLDFFAITDAHREKCGDSILQAPSANSAQIAPLNECKWQREASRKRTFHSDQQNAVGSGRLLKAFMHK